MENFNIRIYGTDWCGDCQRVKKFFKEHQIFFEWIDIDHDTEAEQLVIKTNHGNRSVPTIFLPDGNILVEPSQAVLKEKILDRYKGM